MSLYQLLRADIDHLNSTYGKENRKSIMMLFLIRKAVRLVVIFRILNYHYLKGNKFVLLLLLPLGLYYRIMANRANIFISIKTKIGPGLKINHLFGIVINSRVVIGSNCYIAHNVTIGSVSSSKIPRIGNNVTIFTGSIIIGDVTIGDNVTVGAGSLVIKDIPADTVVVGNPCHILKQGIN